MRDINIGLKYFREFSSSLAASALRKVSQKSTTLDLTSFLYASCDIGCSKRERGEGSSYLRLSSLIFRNYEPEDGFAEVN